jgi:hypothetical protein
MRAHLASLFVPMSDIGALTLRSLWRSHGLGAAAVAWVTVALPQLSAASSYPYIIIIVCGMKLHLLGAINGLVYRQEGRQQRPR